MTLLDIYPLLIVERLNWFKAARGDQRAQAVISRERAVFESLLNELLGGTFS